MIQAGYPPDQIDAYIQQFRVDEPEFFPDESGAPVLFSRLQTQWQRNGTGSLTGLNYMAIEPVARMLEVEMTPQVFTHLQVMESHVLKEMSERDRRSRAQRQIHWR